VSCGAAGNCSAGGYYTDASGHYQAFVVNETDGTWRKAQKVPGSAALNQDGYGELDSVSCAAAGNCSATGSYTDSSRHQQAFVVNETDGTWRKAQKVPGSAALNQDGYGGLGSVSCASAGNCSASGYYTDGSGHEQAFVVGETHGSWGTAQEVPGTAGLNKGGFAGISSLSCASAGNCSAGGYYTDGSRHEQAFVVDETHGSWGPAGEVPGTAALNKGGSAGISSLSCTSVGNCSAGGYYGDSSGHQQVFVVNETHGSWGPAGEVPGSAALNQGGYAALDSVSCGAAGNCSAGGLYEDASGNYQAFVVSETNGSWGPAGEVAGTAALNQGGAAAVSPVSCAAAGQCSAGGSYKPDIGNSSVQAFVVSQTASPGAGSRRSTGRG
jgi:hypothetical protein